MIGAPIVVMVREVPRGEGGRESARRLLLARTEADVDPLAIDHGHVADGKERPQDEHRQQHEREQRRAPPRRHPEG